jgi:hypothetical protein
MYKPARALLSTNAAIACYEMAIVFLHKLFIKSFQIDSKSFHNKTGQPI